MDGLNDEIGPWELHYRRGAPLWRGSPYPLLDLPVPSRVLDLGCGTGSTVIRAAERGHEVVGIDVSATALETAERRLKERRLEAHLIEGDISTRSIGKDRFDLILAHYVMGALPSKERKRTAENIEEMLAFEGILSFEDLSRGDLREGKGEEIEEWTYLKENGISQHFFAEDEVRALFNGLDVVDIDTLTWSHGGFERRRIRAELRRPGEQRPEEHRACR